MANTDPCIVDGCDRPRVNRGRWCSTHHNRHYRHGDVTKVVPVAERAFPRGPEHPSWKGDDLSYSGMHQRTRRERGDASAHACTDCGATAAEWSYDGADPDERCDHVGRYSTDPAHYVPRCVPCHRTHDLAAAS